MPNSAASTADDPRLLRAIVESSTDALAINSLDGRYLYCNVVAAQMFGLQVEEIIGRTREELFAQDFAAALSVQAQHVVTTGVSETREHLLRSTDGMRVVEVTKSPYRDEQGDIVGLIVVSRDISARRNADNALRASEARLRLLIEYVPATIVMLDREMRYLAMSNRCREDFGLCNHDIIGLSHYENFPNVPEHWKEAHRRSLAGEVVRCEEDRYDLGDGSKRWVRWETYPWRHLDGAIGGIVIFSEDITKRKVAELEVRDRERRFHDLADSIPQIVWIAGPDGGLIQLNAKTAEYTGLPVEDLRGWSWDRVIHPMDLPRAIEEWSGSLRTGIPEDSELRIRRYDGEYRWHMVRQMPVRNESGEIVAWYGTNTDIHDLKTVTTALRDSERRLTDAQHFAKLGSWEWEPSTGRVWWSDAECLLFGVDPQIVRPSFEAFLALLHPDDRPTAIARVQAMLAGAEAFDNELRLIRDDGGVTWIHSRGRAIRDAMGKILRVEGIDQDITERKRIEHALHDSEETFRATFEQAAVGISHVGLDGRWLRVNSRFAEMIGYTSEELSLLDVHRVTHPDDHDVTPVGARQLLAGECSSVAAEKRYLRKDGTTLWVNVTVSLRRSVAGEPLYFIGVVEDIGRRKEAEESRLRLTRLVECSDDFIAIADLTGRLTFLNDGGSRMIGLEPKTDVSTIHFEDYVPEEWRAFFRQTVVPAMRDTGTWQGEMQFRNLKTGKLIDVQRTSFLIRDTAGNPDCFATVTRDITAQKVLAEQFRQAQKMEAIGRLAGGIAHDFNNLLTVIGGYSELILARLREGDPLRDQIAAIRDAGEWAARLTSQLLAFSRKAIVEPKVLDVDAVVESTARMLTRLIGENIQLTIRPARTPCRVMMDQGHLEQVLMNLAVNARDAMPTGGRLTIATGDVTVGEGEAERLQGATPGRYIRLDVADTGHGMTKEVRQRMFEPFFTTKPQGQGTGLGLAVVHGAVAQCGGQVLVDSELGIGTTFSVLLPASTDIEEPALPPRDPSHPSATVTVLLVEDEAAIRKLARISLEGAGHKVLEAANGLEGIRLAASNSGSIDLLVTDIVMPELGGRELCDALRKSRPELRVLFLSGYIDDEFVNSPSAFPGTAFLRKPFTGLELSRKVSAMVTESSGLN